MNIKARVLVTALGLMLTALPAAAHHQFSAEFDKDKPVHLTGTVSKIDWSNPHAMVYVDAKGDNGQATSWTVELGGPGALKRRGWATTSVKAGDQVTIDGWRAKDGTHRANAKTVMLADGKKLNAASSYFATKKSRNTH